MSVHFLVKLLNFRFNGSNLFFRMIDRGARCGTFHLISLLILWRWLEKIFQILPVKSKTGNCIGNNCHRSFYVVELNFMFLFGFSWQIEITPRIWIVIFTIGWIKKISRIVFLTQTLAWISFNRLCTSISLWISFRFWVRMRSFVRDQWNNF